jgi:hypothetical protein
MEMLVVGPEVKLLCYVGFTSPSALDNVNLFSKVVMPVHTHSH